MFFLSTFIPEVESWDPQVGLGTLDPRPLQVKGKLMNILLIRKPNWGRGRECVILLK